jgi:flagellar FliJ protein
MKTFRFRLATLLRLRSATRDQRRAQLAEAHRADDMIGQEQQRLGQELASRNRRQRAASGPGEIDVDQLLAEQRYALLLHGQQQHLDRQRQLLAAEIERRRGLLVEADREVRVLEKLEQRQRGRHVEEANRLDVRELDEVAHRRAVPEDAP